MPVLVTIESLAAKGTINSMETPETIALMVDKVRIISMAVTAMTSYSVVTAMII